MVAYQLFSITIRGIRQQNRQTQLSSHSVDKRLVLSRDVPGRDRCFFPAGIKPAQAIKRAALLTLLERPESWK
jgi:hypothetical protein